MIVFVGAGLMIMIGTVGHLAGVALVYKHVVCLEVACGEAYLLVTLISTQGQVFLDLEHR